MLRLLSMVWYGMVVERTDDMMCIFDGRYLRPRLLGRMEDSLSIDFN